MTWTYHGGGAPAGTENPVVDGDLTVTGAISDITTITLVPSGGDDGAQIIAATAAIQTAGGGTLHLYGDMSVFGVGTVYTSLGAFTSCNGVRIIGHKCTLTVTQTFGASFNAFFYFIDCNDVAIEGITAAGTLSAANVAAGALRGPEFCRFVSGNSNIRMWNNTVTGLVAAAIFGNSNPALAHNTNILIGNLQATQCIYGASAQFAADDMTIINLRTDSVGRSYFIYGTSRTSAHVYSKNAKLPEDVKLWSSQGYGNVDCELWYHSDATSTARTNSQVMIELHFGYDSAVVLHRNIKIHLDVQFPGAGLANTGICAFLIRKMTTGGTAFDTTDRGHVLDGLTIDGWIKDYPTYGGFGLIDVDPNSKWGAVLDSWYNINIENLHADSATFCRLSCAALKGTLSLRNVHSNASFIIQQQNYVPALDDGFPLAGRVSIDDGCSFANLRYFGAGGGSALRPIRLSTNTTITASYSGQIVSNDAAAGNITLALPAASAGNLAAALGPITFLNTRNVGWVRVDPNGGDLIYPNAAGKYIELAFGASVTLIPTVPTVWQIVSSQGTITVEP